MSRAVDARHHEEEIKVAALTRPLRFWQPFGTARDEGWLAIKTCGYATYEEAREAGKRVENALLISAAKRQLGVEFIGRGAACSVAVFSEGQSDVVDPGAPLPAPLKVQELRDIVTTAVESASALTANQRIAAELLNSSFFEISPEARFLLRISAVEALCPQACQPDAIRNLAIQTLARIPPEATPQDRNQLKEALTRLAVRQTVRQAYMSKIKSLLGDDKAKRFDNLYGRRSNFLHDGEGCGTFGDAANVALEIGLDLLLAEISQSPQDKLGE